MGVLLGRKMANELGENGKMNGKYGKMGMDGGFEVFFLKWLMVMLGQ